MIFQKDNFKATCKNALYSTRCQLANGLVLIFGHGFFFLSWIIRKIGGFLVYLFILFIYLFQISLYRVALSVLQILLFQAGTVHIKYKVNNNKAIESCTFCEHHIS